ncbi:MAG: hypothetical protein ACFCU8_09575 [Thermosynechococcaceae cyanobacterium]
MTRFRFDQFSKQYLEELLAPLGEVTIGKELLGEARQIDVWFVPYPQPTAPDALGLLGRLGSMPCLLEAYRHPPKPSEIRDCLLKLFLTQSDDQRQAKRNKKLASEAELPKLWVIATSTPDSLLSGFSATTDEANWGAGIYFLPPHLHTGIIAVNQLPETPDTLWLRLLGKGKTQAQAITELIELSRDNPMRSRALELLAHWRIMIETSESLDADDQELIMQLSPVYTQKLNEATEEARQRGQQEGRQEGRQERRLMLEALLKARFGELDAQLEQVIDPILQLSATEYAQLILQLSRLSREQILRRFA